MPQAHTSPGPIQSLRAHAGRLMRQYTPPESGSLRHQGLMCTALSLVLITIFLGTYLAMGAGREVALGSGVAAVLMAGFVIDAILLLRFYACDPKAHRRLKELSWSSIALNSVLVGLLSLLMWGRDNEFYVLMIVPVLQAAIWLDLGGTAGVLLVSIFLNFLGAFPMDADEWAEAAAGSLIYALVAIVVWLLVNSLRDREARLKHNLEELARTRERLMAEEKLAAVGRLASAIAHEIRNPIAMITSSLVTARYNGQTEADRQRLFEIASSEAGRLERLTSDFLTYARAREIALERANVLETLEYVAGIARAHPDNGGVGIEIQAAAELEADFDVSQLQQALLNMAMNALDACQPGQTVVLQAERRPTGAISFQVIDPAGPIPAGTTARIFEPFFTTKPHGTGLGLAIARNIARAHGGDLTLSVNQPGRVCFAIEIPQHSARGPGRESAS